LGSDEPQAYFTQAIGADRLHDQGITGYGVTVAILDTGVWDIDPLTRNSFGADRIVAAYNSIKNKEGMRHIKDKNGHGSHVSSIAVNSENGSKGKFNGVAPDADLVVVQSFDKKGRGSYLDVIRGIDWVVAHKDEYNIRVLNCSFSAEPQSHYWDDPVNQAVMAAWKAGIVVVTSAGNKGPDPMTVGVPGNCPYVITVGAMTDNYTPEILTDDLLASFSAAGPTVEGFVKPEIVAPGGHLLGMMEKKHQIPSDHPEFHDTNKYFVMSGTSQAAAVTTGAAALLLQAEPWLEPDEVKCRLMATAQVAVDGAGYPAYSIFQQGSGLLAVDAAVADDCGELGTCPTECANVGLDVAVDLDPVLETHYGGPVRMDENGDFFIEDDDTDVYLWDGEYLLSGGFLWNSAFLWNNAYLWNNSYLWNNTFLWNNGYLWNNTFLWFNSYADFDGYKWSPRLAEAVSTNVWVEQE
jgi:serine protease AprX